MDRGAWWDTVHGVAGLDMTEQHDTISVSPWGLSCAG